jgi:SAM-dependent methyltransferase
LSSPEQFNADQLAFWNGRGGQTWVARQAHTDTTLSEVSAELLDLAAPRPGERVLDVGCGCGASSLDMARAVGPGGRVVALDISGPMLEEARARAAAAGIGNVQWLEADAATAALEDFDLLVSNCGLMFFGDPVPAFRHLHDAAASGARMAFVCWGPLAENPWIRIPMQAVAPHLPPRPSGNPEAPGMFAFADPGRVTRILTASGWASPRTRKREFLLDIAAGHGLDEAVVQSTQIGAVNSWLRGQPPEVVEAAVASLRAALAPFQDGARVCLPGTVWLVQAARS